MKFSEIEHFLLQDDFEAVGQITTASNGALLLKSKDHINLRAIFKPKIGIRKLWDFPKDDLIEREMASYLLSKMSGLDLIPPTAIREIEPFGEGMIQFWIENSQVTAVKLFSPEKIDTGYIEVLQANDSKGELVSVAALNSSWMDSLILFDAVVNNSDRKASHILTEESGQMWAIDHGVTWHHESKLRTILWSRVSAGLSLEHIDLLNTLIETLNIEKVKLECLLSHNEVQMAIKRAESIRTTRSFPEPPQEWPAIPWPIF